MPLVDYPHRMFVTFTDPLGFKNPLQIPLPPENITGGTTQSVTTFKLIKLGEVSTIGGRDLVRFRWESLFPFIYDPSIEIVDRSEHIDPATWIKLFTNAQEEHHSVRITIGNTPIDFRASVPSFKWAYVPGPPKDVWYQIEMIEDRQGYIREFSGFKLPILAPREEPIPPGLTDVVVPEGGGRGTVRRPVPIPHLWVTREGDTFAKISQAIFGHPDYALRLFELNRDRYDFYEEIANWGAIVYDREPFTQNGRYGRVMPMYWFDDPMPRGFTINLVGLLL